VFVSENKYDDDDDDDDAFLSVTPLRSVSCVLTERSRVLLTDMDFSLLAQAPANEF